MKGITQVVTAALILAVAVAVAGVYANWAPTFSEKAAENVRDQSNQEIKCSNAGFSIKKAVYDLSGNFTEVEVKNTETINFYNDFEAVAINSSRSNIILGKDTLDQLEVNQVRTFRINSDKVPEEVYISSKDCPQLKAQKSVKIVD